MTERELALRRTLMEGFARDGRPPPLGDAETLRALVQRRVVVLDDEDPPGVAMAHPFAAPGASTRVSAGDAVWWGNCAWDGLGIVAALGLRDAAIESGDVEITVHAGRVLEEDVLFHVAVPAARWWDDIAFT